MKPQTWPRTTAVPPLSPPPLRDFLFFFFPSCELVRGMCRKKKKRSFRIARSCAPLFPSFFPPFFFATSPFFLPPLLPSAPNALQVAYLSKLRVIEIRVCLFPPPFFLFPPPSFFFFFSPIWVSHDSDNENGSCASCGGGPFFFPFFSPFFPNSRCSFSFPSPPLPPFVTGWERLAVGKEAAIELGKALFWDQAFFFPSFFFLFLSGWKFPPLSFLPSFSYAQAADRER